jgi:hypothetical protein
MIYVPSGLGGFGFPCEEEFLIEKLEKLPPLILAAVVEATKPDCPPEIRKSLALFRTNTTFRGLTINDTIAEQTSGFFKMNPGLKTLEELKIFLKIPDRQWRLMRRKDKVQLAERKGYISLHTAMEQLLRPVYFYEVMTGQTSLMLDSPEWKALAKTREALYDEFRLGVPPEQSSLAEKLRREEKAYNDIAWTIQRDTYLRVASKVGRFSTEAEAKSFKTLSWDRRLEEVQYALHAYKFIREADPAKEILRLADFIRDEIVLDYSSNVFVPSDILRDVANMNVTLPVD